MAIILYERLKKMIYFKNKTGYNKSHDIKFQKKNFWF
jgi:hypothetical protein